MKKLISFLLTLLSFNCFSQTVKPLVYSDIIDSFKIIVNQNQFQGDCYVGSMQGSSRIDLSWYSKKYPLLYVDYTALGRHAREGENLSEFTSTIISNNDILENGTKMISAHWKKGYGKFNIACVNQEQKPLTIYMEIRGEGWVYYAYHKLTTEQFNRLKKYFYPNNFQKTNNNPKKKNSSNSFLNSLNIKDLNAHRKYQDGIFSSAKNFNDTVAVARRLVNEYIEIANPENINSSAYYSYIARIYFTIATSSFYENYYDIENKQVKNSEIYSKFYDSTFYYLDKSIKISPTNVYSMYLLCCSMYSDYSYFRVDRKKIPFSGIRNEKAWEQRNNFILNNASAFVNQFEDRFQNAELSKYGPLTEDDYDRFQGIAEISLRFIDLNANSLQFNPNDKNGTKILVLYGKIYRFIKKLDGHSVIDYTEDAKKRIENEIMPNVLKAEDFLNRN